MRTRTLLLLCLTLFSGCGVGPMVIKSDPPKEEAQDAPRGTAKQVASEHLDVRFARKDVVRVVHEPAASSKSYPHLITFRGRKEPERGLVLETTPESILVRLPRKSQALPAGVPGTTSRFLGGVQGRVVRRRKPLEGCQVRLTGLRYETRFLVFTSLKQRGHEETVVTDRAGRFSFENLPPGPYRLAFRRPGSNVWLLRLRRSGVDAVVKDRPVKVGTINLSKRALD